MKFLKFIAFTIISISLLLAVYLYRVKGGEYTFSEYRILYNVNDIGVAPLENGDIFRWTINHSALQVISNATIDELSSHTARLGMLQDPDAPFMEPSLSALTVPRPVNIYLNENTLTLTSHNLTSAVSGSVKIPWEATSTSSGSAITSSTSCNDNGYCTVIEFQLSGSGRAEIETVPPNSNGFPIHFDLSKDVNLADIGLGTHGLAPISHQFSYHSKDRHAWALKTNIEGNKDIFVSRGGARGLLENAHPEAKDEFFRWNGNTYKDVIDGTGITKQSCPGRQSSWFDVNNDGLLDLYQVCGRLRGDNSNFPNRLYIQVATDRFVEQAANYGLDFSSAGSFHFINNTTQNGEFNFTQFVWATDSEIEVFQLENGRFKSLWQTARTGSFTDDITVGDINSDGQWEALITAQYDSRLIGLRDGQVEEIDLKTLDVPKSLLGGGFYDDDGDGFHELLLLPYGMYKNNQGRYEHSSALDLSWVRDWGEVRYAWLDHDHDGDLDLWVTNSYADLPKTDSSLKFLTEQKHLPNELKVLFLKLMRKFKMGHQSERHWESRLYTNNRGNQCSRIIPAGFPGNIDMLGQKITITNPETQQPAYFYFGFSENSKYSQTMNELIYCGATVAPENIKTKGGFVIEPLKR